MADIPDGLVPLQNRPLCPCSRSEQLRHRHYSRVRHVGRPEMLPPLLKCAFNVAISSPRYVCDDPEEARPDGLHSATLGPDLNVPYIVTGL
jgi:hypothetical protein